MEEVYHYQVLKRVTPFVRQKYYVRIVASNGETVYVGEKKANKSDIIRIARRENRNRIKPYPIIDFTGKGVFHLDPIDD